jgi:sulfopropanediol 3-dehydrogenase
MATHFKSPAGGAQRKTSDPTVRETVATVIADMRERGDAAVREYSEKFDRWSPEQFRLTPEQIQASIDAVSDQAVEDIKAVQHRVRTLAQHQRESLRDFEVETEPGVHLGQKNIPVASAGA